MKCVNYKKQKKVLSKVLSPYITILIILGHAAMNIISNNNINNKQDYNQYSFTVPANGRYFVSFTQQLGSNAANGYGLTLKIKLDSTTICQSGAAITGNAAYMYATVSCVVSANAGQVITCTSTGGSTNSTTTANGRVSLARIA